MFFLCVKISDLFKLIYSSDLHLFFTGLILFAETAFKARNAYFGLSTTMN